MKLQILNVSKIVLVTFIFSSLIMILMKKIAVHIGAIDMPRSDEGNRHIHKKPTPMLGGVGIFFKFFIWIYALWRTKYKNEFNFNWKFYYNFNRYNR